MMVLFFLAFSGFKIEATVKLSLFTFLMATCAHTEGEHNKTYIPIDDRHEIVTNAPFGLSQRRPSTSTNWSCISVLHSSIQPKYGHSDRLPKNNCIAGWHSSPLHRLWDLQGGLCSCVSFERSQRQYRTSPKNSVRLHHGCYLCGIQIL